MSAATGAAPREAGLALIVAMDLDRLIGIGADLPWRLPKDLAHFKRLTMGKTILMGRRTWDSIGRPLPGRDNWVVSRDAGFAPAGARRFDSLDAALAAPRSSELVIIGGGELYRQTLDRATHLYLAEVQTRIDADPARAVRFPAFDRAAFRECSREDHPADERHAYAYRFLVFERKDSAG